MLDYITVGSGMSDDNILDIQGDIKSKKEKNKPIKDRVKDCCSDPDCDCIFCTFKDQAAEHMVQLVGKEVVKFQEAEEVEMCTWDLKDICYRAVVKIRNLESDAKED